MPMPEALGQSQPASDVPDPARPAIEGPDPPHAVSEPAGRLRPVAETIAVDEPEQIAVAAEADRPSASAEAESTDASAEPRGAEEVAAEQVAAEQVTALLSNVLDRLGAAHHRPFSRG